MRLQRHDHGIRLLRGLCALGAIAAAGCSRVPDLPRRGEGMNVLLISLDTTRADRLGCYGQAGDPTPHIDRLAREGVLFEQCSSAVPITLPSHATMLCGTWPFVHGVRDNGSFQLRAENESLAEVLHARGYATAAEIAAFVLNREFGLNQGFEVYNDIQTARDRARASTRQAFVERPAAEVADSAIESIARDAAGPFFHFVHFFDPHRPWEAPAEWAARQRDPYLAEIAYVDAQIGRILDALQRRGVLDRTLVVVTADHGEGLFEHNEETHSAFIYDTTMRVPLVLWRPGHLPAGRRIPWQVRTADIAPTILDFLGGDPLSGANGVSLLPATRDGAADPGLTAYGESLYGFYNYGYAALRMLRGGGWKYIHAPRPELYLVASDAGEVADVAAGQPARVAEMRAALRALIEQSPPVRAAGSARLAVTPAAQQALGALGYASGGDAASQPSDSAGEMALFEPVGINPMDRADEIRLTSHAMWLMRTGDMRTAEATLRQILAQTGEQGGSFAWAHANLGNILWSRGKLSEAAEHFRVALRSNPRDGRTLTNLGLTLEMLGQIDEAEQHYRAAIDVPPVFAQSHVFLARLLAGRGDLDAALEHNRQALRLDPNLPLAHVQIAEILARRNDEPAARAELARAVELAPDGAPIRRQCGEVLLLLGKPDEALRELELSRRLAPNVPITRVRIADALRRLSRPADALPELNEALRLNPRVPGGWDALADTLIELRQFEQAIAALKRGVEALPEDSSLHNNLGWLLAVCPDDAFRDPAAALQHAQEARRIAGSTPQVLDTLAAAQAAAGSFDDALSTLDEALRLAGESGDSALRERLAGRRALYAQRKPFRLESSPP
ncbi:MAG: Beta-barrel assembly-enhancing protease [Phycisphaerae bacterium]|nr:Beta-barrel assembly-enhancing protease [Phycisphaerae bacterium]